MKGIDFATSAVFALAVKVLRRQGIHIDGVPLEAVLAIEPDDYSNEKTAVLATAFGQ